MTRRGIIIASFIGLASSVVETALIPSTLSNTTDTTAISLVAVLLAVLSAGIAGRVILGTRSVHRYFRAGVPILSAISALAWESGVSNWLIANDVFAGAASRTFRPAVITALIIGAVVYLLAATVYGFAGTAQGVSVGNRVGLLLLLLLAVLPGLNILGSVGFVLTAFLRAPAGHTPTTPEPPAASG
jgi:hypothetical protein